MCHVLIIEDDALLALQLEGLLTDHGASTFSYAAGCAEAVEAALAKPPRVITADVRLRDGTGPGAVAEIIRRLGVAIPTLFITGTPAECEPCGPPHRVFEKPMDEEEVASAFVQMAFA